MAISIQPITLVIVIILVINCIMSFGNSDVMNKCHIILSSIISVIGLVWMIVIRPSFLDRLIRNAKTRNFKTDFVDWAIEKFDTYAIISMIITCIIILLLIVYLLFNKEGFVWDHMTLIVIAFMVCNIFAGIWYGLGTINKLFDIGGYISQLTIAEFFAFHIPLVVKRIIMRKIVNAESLID